MPVTYTEDPATRTVELAVSGHISRADFDALAPRIEAFAEAHGPVW